MYGNSKYSSIHIHTRMHAHMCTHAQAHKICTCLSAWPVLL